MTYELPLNISTPTGYFDWAFEQTQNLPPYLFLLFTFIVSSSWLYYFGAEREALVGSSLLTLIVAIFFNTLGWVNQITLFSIFGIFAGSIILAIWTGR